MAGNVAEWVADVYRPTIDNGANDFNYFRGNIFTKKMINSEGKVVIAGDDTPTVYDTLPNGKIVPKQLPGTIKYMPITKTDATYRRNFSRSNNANIGDGDLSSTRWYEKDSLENNNNPGFSAWANKLFSSTDSSATGSAETASSSSAPATAPVTEPAPFPSPTTVTPTPNITNASIIVAALLPPKVLPVTNGMDATNAAHALRFQAAALQREPNRNDTIAKEQAAEQKRNDREEQEAAQKNTEMIKEEEAERDEESQQSAFENEIDAALHAAMAEEKKQNALAQDKIKKEDAEAERIQQDEIRQQEIERKERLFNRTRHLQEQASKFIQQKKMDENRKQMEEKMKETKKLIQHQNTIATFKKQFIHQYVAKEHRLKDAFQIDTIRHSILDDSLGVEGCSEIGRWSKKRQQCLCPNGHGGEF
jgi:flagellar biosynthesis GTPase FlhF